jgi:DNA polymerase-3 subunit gamma/tau
MEKDPVIESVPEAFTQTPAESVEEKNSALSEQSSSDEEIQAQLSAEMENIEQVAAQQLQQEPVQTAHQNRDHQPVVTEHKIEQTEKVQALEPQASGFAEYDLAPTDQFSENNVEPVFDRSVEADLGSVVEASHIDNIKLTQQQIEQPHTHSFHHEQVADQSTAQPSVSQEEAVTYSSPVESAIATRNMLRSRKKQMEQQVKKPNDVAGRQTKTTDATVSSTEEKQETEQVAKPIEMIIDEPYREELIDPTKIKSANQVDKWANMIDSMALSARIRQIAIHATISEESTDSHLILLLDQATKHLKTDAAVEQLQQSISNYLSKPVTVEINLVEETKADPYKIQVDINDKRYQYAVNLLKEDEIVKGLQDNFQAELDENTIQAL